MQKSQKHKLLSDTAMCLTIYLLAPSTAKQLTMPILLWENYSCYYVHEMERLACFSIPLFFFFFGIMHVLLCNYMMQELMHLHT